MLYLFLVEVCVAVRCGIDCAIQRNAANEITGIYSKEQVGRVQSLSPAVTLSTMLLAEEIKDITTGTDHFALNSP